MQIDKILETVFIKEWNTTAQILENEILIQLWYSKFYDRKECYEYINQHERGRVQTSLYYRKTKDKTTISKDYKDTLVLYDELFYNLETYALSKYNKEFKKPKKLNSFNFKWNKKGL